MRAMRNGERIAVAFANAHTLNVAAENPDFRLALQNALVLNDGLGVDIASRILYGSPFPENLNGTDFVPNYLRRTKHRYRIFLLGAKPGHRRARGKRLSDACAHGTRSSAVTTAISIRAHAPKSSISFAAPGPMSLLVAMGNPKQELFIQDHLAATGCRLGIGVGALFDFLAGNVPRAPPWVQRWRLEWVYRLATGAAPSRRPLPDRQSSVPDADCRQWWSGSRVKASDPTPSRAAAMTRLALPGPSLTGPPRRRRSWPPEAEPDVRKTCRYR